MSEPKICPGCKAGAHEDPAYGASECKCACHGLRQFVEIVAALHLDGEQVDGEAFILTDEDAYMTVENLIATARGLVKKEAR